MNEFYKNIKLIENPDDLLVLVNKNNMLYQKFIPNNLEKINELYSVDTKYLRSEAKECFEKLCKDAKKLNLSIKAESTYRSFEYQKKLYDNYVLKYGSEYANACSAKPGHSEHQTGLAVDVRGSEGDYNNFSNTKEFSWMIKNAPNYGFILRYPYDKQNITGFKYEPWHYRYVGKIALEITKNNLTLEEYLENNI